MYKNVKVGFMSLFLLILLSGCGSYSGTKGYLSVVEKGLLLEYYREYSLTGYDGTLKELRDRRRRNDYVELSVPFCDVIEELMAEESADRSSVRNREAISMIWKRERNESLENSCAKVGYTSEGHTEKDAYIKPYIYDVVKKDFEIIEKGSLKVKVSGDNGDFVVVEGVTLLSPKKVVELTELLKECKSAKEKVSAILNNKYLKEGDYETITKIELSCAYDELMSELVKG